MNKLWGVLKSGKRCRICQQNRPPSDFYDQPGSRDGKRNECRFCFSDAVCRRQRENGDRYKAYQRQWRKENQEMVRVYEHSHAQSPERRARNSAKAAAKWGTIARPQECPRCGSQGKEIHAHHEDYSRPLDVRWLCEGCHFQLHREQRREESVVAIS